MQHKMGTSLCAYGFLRTGLFRESVDYMVPIGSLLQMPVCFEILQNSSLAVLVFPAIARCRARRDKHVQRGRIFDVLRDLYGDSWDLAVLNARVC